MCQNHKGIETSRQFGVELEGYTDTNIRDDYIRINGVTWDAKDDGSLDDDDSECIHCEGSGREDCHVCDGEGNVECEECGGKGYSKCDNCNNGRVTCEDCNGTGGCDEETCESCDGDGWIICQECDDGEIECSDCDGRGNVECYECEGEGRQDCHVCDGSGNSDEYGRYGVEVVSPPIQNTIHIHEIYEKLRGDGWEVDLDAGLHIHVDAGDYTNEDFQKILALMVGVEPVIYSMNNRYRFSGSSYCSPITRFRQQVIRRLSAPHYATNYEFANTRYMGLNFEAVDAHGTIEFRYFSPRDGRDASEKVENFVELVTKIVEFAKNASMEQILVIVKHLIRNKDNFDELANIVKETFQLSYTPWNESSAYRHYQWFALSEVEHWEAGMGLVASTQAEQAV